MWDQMLRHLALVLAALLMVTLCFEDASAQQRRRNKRSRRITNPVASTAPVVQPDTSSAQTSDPTIISTAEDQQRTEPSPVTRRTRNRAPADEPDPEAMRRTINRLSNEVTKLSEKLSEMETQQRTLVDLERLSRAEQRAENLRAQLRDVQTKESDLQARMDQLDFDLRPENIERVVSGFGTTRPEEARDQRRRLLENEKARVRTQLDQHSVSRARLETAIATADAEVERLRERVDTAAMPTRTDTGDTATGGASNAAPPTPASTPPPTNHAPSNPPQ